MKTVIGNKNSVFIDNYNTAKIYILITYEHNDVYKAHDVDDGWSFISLDDTVSRSTGTHQSLKALLENDLEYGEILEFDNYKEMIKYLYERK